jgi:2-dehydro-3-deoxyphosphogluconate aldolase/(4S)-4-hydroxy-2-oxoglutarate aldolase
MKTEIIKAIETHKIIAILRRIRMKDFIQTVDALYKGGIRLMEVTFDQAGEFTEETTLEQIKLIKSHYNGQVLAGAGTVMNVRQVKAAYEAGAGYIISPNTNKDVIEEAVRLGLVSMPGALTPTEIQNAHEWGADFVKVFPADDMGPGYIKSISAPLNHIKLIAVGGISSDNLADYIKAGAVGVGVASSLVDRKLIESGRFDSLTELARQFTGKIS